MAIEGPLKELGIHDVFQLLDLSRKTGILRVTSELRHNQGTIYFDNGRIAYAEIQSNPHPLGELLVRAGKISDADVTRARAMQEQGDQRRLGEILVVIGALTNRELERYVSAQVEEVVFEVMSWREGYFSFAEGPLEENPAEATANISTESLLLEGARRIDEWSRIEGLIPHLGVVPRIAAVPSIEGGRVDLLPGEWELLAGIDGTTDIRGIAAGTGHSEFEVAKTVFGMACAGLVEISDEGRKSGALAAQAARDLEATLGKAEAALDAGDVEEARRLADSVRAAHPHAAGAHFLLGRLDLLGKQPQPAEEHLRRALRLDPLLAPAHRLLGDALALQGRLAEAAEWWERWLRFGARDGETDEQVQRVREGVEAARHLTAMLSADHG